MSDFIKTYPKLWAAPHDNGTNDVTYFFWCPGCKKIHPYQVPRWTFNGDMNKPTFTPSLKMLDIPEEWC